MIFPYLNGFLSFKKIPMTWVLVWLNVFMFVMTHREIVTYKIQLHQNYSNEYFVKTNGKIFAHFISENKKQYSGILVTMAEKAMAGDLEKLYRLSNLGFRDDLFFKNAPLISDFSDKVALVWWQGEMKKLKMMQKTNPTYTMGVSSFDAGVERWFSYQFIHSGFMHILGNMFFLILFGGLLEPIIGGLALLVVYLGAGVLAAGTFVLVSGVNLAPLVGASGAVSGIMAFLFILFGSRPVRYLWFVGFSRGNFGYVYLPAWISFIMWVVMDLGGFISEINLVSGVAYTAHLGGEATGLILAFIVILIRTIQKKEIIGEDDSLPKSIIGKKIDIA